MTADVGPDNVLAGERAAIPGYVHVCTLADLPADRAVSVTVEGRPVAVVRAEGRVYAIHDECSHAEVPLSEGDVEGTTLECWLHGSRFDLCSGRPINLPATRPVPVYDVHVEGEHVYVSRTPHGGGKHAKH